LRLEIAREDSYLVTTRTEFTLHVRHRILQIVEPLLQRLNPRGIHLTIGFLESDSRLQVLDLCRQLPVLLLDIENLLQEKTIVALQFGLRQGKAVVTMLGSLESPIQRQQVLVDTPKDTSGVMDTLTPFSLQSVLL